MICNHEGEKRETDELVFLCALTFSRFLIEVTVTMFKIKKKNILASF